MRVGLVLLGLLLAGVAHPADKAGDDAALRVVDACRARLDSRTDVGIERIQRRCPDLLPALANAPWRDLLPLQMRDRREEITAESLRALSDLVRHANDGAGMRVAPERERLAPVLAELGEKGQQGATRWERFKRWLKDKLEKRKDDDETGWFEKWARKFETSEGIAQVITYGGYFLVGVLVLFVIVSELRAARIFGGSRRAGGRLDPAAEWRRRLMLADVAAAPLAERPGMLLRLLGEALSRAHRLPAPEGMTANAIARRAELDSDSERDELTQVATTADVVRYGNDHPSNDALESTVSQAKRLLEKFVRGRGKR